MDKIAALNGILELDPTNAFARYGLAMEHLNHGHADAALAEFARVLEHNPDYVPAFQMSAQTLARNHRIDEAVAMLQQGLGAAQRTGNTHAAGEMQSLLDDLIAGR
jgi:Tfp pilus assembly protein PilF